MRSAAILVTTTPLHALRWREHLQIFLQDVLALIEHEIEFFFALLLLCNLCPKGIQATAENFWHSVLGLLFFLHFLGTLLWRVQRDEPSDELVDWEACIRVKVQPANDSQALCCRCYVVLPTQEWLQIIFVDEIVSPLVNCFKGFLIIECLWLIHLEFHFFCYPI